MRTNCPYCGVEVEVDVEGFNDGEELQTACPECGRDFEFVVEGAPSAPSDYFYLDKNNEQNGPLSPDALAKVITSQTLVWKKGMADWIKAEDVPELRSIVKENVPPPIPKPAQAVDIPKPIEDKEVEYQPIKPDNHMIMAILCTLFCCIPTGVYAIYCASKVDGLYYQGDYIEAEEYASKAETWSYWGIGFGIALDILYFICL